VYSILHYLPRKFLSRLFGKLAAIELPYPLSLWSVAVFCKLAKIDADSASMPIGQYRSIAQFFVRDLKPEMRPIGAGLVSPVDGTLREVGQISSEGRFKIKGFDYSLDELIGTNEFSSKLIGGTFLNFYLSPRDCHHLFCPIDAKLLKSVYVPGDLWPVNEWGLSQIQGLFVRNERLTTVLESQGELITLTMVGAMNVGQITAQYDSWEKGELSSIVKRCYAERIFRPGEKLATFHLGSSVLMAITPGSRFKIETLSQRKISYGARL